MPMVGRLGTTHVTVTRLPTVAGASAPHKPARPAPRVGLQKLVTAAESGRAAGLRSHCT